MTVEEIVRNWERVALGKELPLLTRQGFWACADDLRLISELPRLERPKDLG